jgi:5-methylcytosine-specific restriction protein A
MARLPFLKPRVSNMGSRLNTIQPDSWRADKNSTERGYGYKWQKARAQYLAEHPLCVMCESEGRTTQAKVVDHTVPHRGDQAIFWDQSRWQALCKRHHDSEAQKRDKAI